VLQGHKQALYKAAYHHQVKTLQVLDAMKSMKLLFKRHRQALYEVTLLRLHVIILEVASAG
jgi:hypothetical protein